MKGSLRIGADDDFGVTITATVTIDPESYSERRTVRELIDYLLDYKQAIIKTEAKEEEANG